MRQLILLQFLILAVLAGAQVPQSFQYQAVARNGSGEVLAAQPLTVELAVHAGSAQGPVVYQETHAVVTSALGLFTLSVGQGTVVSGEFQAVQWGASSHFLQASIDLGGGLLDMGTAQLLSVPYALHAGGTDCATVSLLGDTLKQANGCFVIIPGLSAANGGCLDVDQDGFYHIAGCGPVDCDDTDGQVNPAASEVCGNGLDDDCDGGTDDLVDPLLFLDWHPDADGDGFGDPSITISACAQPADHVLDGTDCNDADPLVFPGMGCSQNCTASDVAWVDQNQFLYFQLAQSEWANCFFEADPVACIMAGLDAGQQTPLALACHQCVAERFVCITQNCIAQCLEEGPACDACVLAAGCDATFVSCMGLMDADGDGWVSGSDCDDADPSRYPNAAEACDGIDNDCDGNVDEGATSAWYPDLDGDGYGDDNGLVIACSPPDPSYVNEGFDCDDTDPLVFPYQGCPGTDCGFFYGVEWGDCSPGSYCDNGVCLPCEDLDGDGFTECDGDCNDSDPSIYPGAIEGCNGIDSNCDGLLGGTTGNEVYSPDWTALSSDGQTVTLFGLLAQGKTVVLDLCAAWCAPSQQMLTSNFLQDWNMHMGPNGTDQIRIVAAAVDQNAGSVAPFIAAAQWPVIVQDAEDLGTLYASIGMYDNAVPTLLMICPDRKVTMLYPQPDVLPYAGLFTYDPVAATALVDANCACNLTPCLTNIGCMDQGSCDFDPNANCPGPCATAQEYFLDNDGDGFGSSSLGTSCTQPPGSSTIGGDCDDNDPDVNPGIFELCGNGVDDNCNGLLDEEEDCD